MQLAQAEAIVRELQVTIVVCSPAQNYNGDAPHPTAMHLIHDGAI